MSDKWKTIDFDFAVDERKERLNPFSREKSRQARQKEGGETMCDPGWYVHKPGVQNKWDDDILARTHMSI